MQYISVTVLCICHVQSGLLRYRYKSFLFGRPLGVFTANDAVSDPITMAQLMTSLANGLMTVYDVAENQSLSWNE